MSARSHRPFVAAARALALAMTAALLAGGRCLAQPALPIDTIRLPEGFSISVLARVRNARAMTWGTNGTLFVGSGSAGDVHAVTLPRDGKGDALVRKIASDLQSPIGVAFRDGALYVSAVERILRFDDIERRLDNPPRPVVVTDRFPSQSGHAGKFIAFGPDGKLYVNVGAPCNICEPPSSKQATIMRMSPDGSDLDIFAKGVRNSVGFDWHPQTREMWFTDNGRDYLGDDAPPDELNHAPRAGMHFGYPYCHGGTIVDPQFSSRGCREFTPPAQALGPHVASLGMRFYTGTQFPAAYRNQIFIAEHGSWNRSSKLGYRVTLVTLQDNKAVKYDVFAEGWLRGESAWGRPVDVAVAPDGSLLVSDDVGGAIYRIRYGR